MKDYGYSIEVNELLWERDKKIERLKNIIDDAFECMHNMDHEKAFKILGGKP